jgi:arylsulfatase A-like enzyme
VAANHGRFVQPDENDTATRQDYLAILERADQGIGQILQTLKRRGLERNTLVIYMQDNRSNGSDDSVNGLDEQARNSSHGQFADSLL